MEELARLRGKPGVPGQALGTAAIIRAGAGVPMLPASLLARRSRAPRDAELEPVDVIVVAEHLQMAEGLAVPWARIAGIAVQEEAVTAPWGGCPVVTGAAGILAAAREGSLILIDGERGIVLVDPDPEAVAGFQAERERLAPRRRVYLGVAHEAARTLDGVEIRVYAAAANADEARAAVAAGADGLYLPPDRGMVLPQESDEEQLAALLELADIAGGKPIIVTGDAESVSAASLLRSAARADMTLAVAAEREVTGLSAIRTHMEGAGDELVEQDLDYGAVQIAAYADTGADPESLTNLPAARLILESDPGGDHAAGRAEWVSTVVWSARRSLVPVLTVASRDEWEGLIRTGVSGLIVEPAEVGDAKAAIRGTCMQG